MFLVVLMAGLMMLVGLAVAGEIGLIVMAVIALGINLYSYYNSHSMVPKMMGGQLVTAQEAPDLYRIVEQAACQAKMPFKPELLSQFTIEHLEARCSGHCRPGDCPRHIPSVYVIDTPIPNAFATGRHPKHSAVAATTGIMGLLNRRELAGVMAAKRTAELIPLCHPLALSAIDLSFEPSQNPPAIICRSRAEVEAKTGVEMEAMTAVHIALLTIYDMCKAIDRAMVIGDIRLIEKSGGRSGTWRRADDA